MRVQVTSNTFLTKLLATDDDRQAVLEHLSDPTIAATTVGIPWPYYGDDFDAMMASADASRLEHGFPTFLAIRQADGLLIGSINFREGIGDGVLVIGFWIPRRYWNQGRMTEAVGEACFLALDEWRFSVIFASVFRDNVATQRVLEKVGFRRDEPAMLNKGGSEIEGRWCVLSTDNLKPPF